MKTPHRENPRIARYLFQGLRHEAIALVLTLQREWRAVMLALALLTMALAAMDPVPPSRLRIAKGQPGSGLEVMALQLRDALAPYGVHVELVDSDGAPDNQAKVSQGLADVGLGQSGLSPMPGVLYLGSIAYQPLWLFHRRGELPAQGDLPGMLIGRRVSLGIQGSGSHFISQRLLEEFGPELRSRIDGRQMNNPDTLNAMQRGELDAAFLLASYESRNTQALLRNPSVEVFDFALAEGISRRWGFTESVVLPAGTVSTHPPRPAHDVRMLAVTMTLVVHEKLHPATQALLLQVSKSVAERSQDVLQRRNGFPAFVDRQLPRSPVAARFYERGTPLLADHLPYWAVSLIDSLWVAALALLAVAYPLLRVMPSSRKLNFGALLSRRYHEMDDIEAELQRTHTREGLQRLIARLDQLVQRSREMWVPNGCHPTHAALMLSLQQVESRLWERLGRYARAESVD